MKRTLQFLLIGSLIAACSPLPARTVNMFDYHGITWRDTLTLAQSGYTYDAAKAQFTAWVGYMEYKGASSKVLDIREFSAAYEDIIWRNDQWASEGTGNNAFYPDGLQSRVNIQIPYGCYRTDIPLTLPNGIIKGEGTGNVLFERRWDGTQGGTTISLDNAGWDGDAAKHYVFKSWNHGIPGGSVAYHESFQLLDLRIEGGDGGPHKTAYDAVGVALWKTGETSVLNNLFVEAFNGTGVRIEGCTPLTIGEISVFHNSIAGIALLGGWGASLNMGTLSGDDNGALFISKPGYGQDSPTSVTEAGGNIHIDLVKIEAFNKAEDPHHQWRANIIDIDGQFNVTIDNVQSGMAWGRVHALFVVRPYLTTGARQSSILKVGTIKGWNYDAALHVIDGANTCEYLSPGDNVGYDFTWASHGAGAFTSIIPLTKRSITCQARLGWARGTGVISSANCSPSYSYVTGASGGSAPPVACTGWTTGAWGTWSTCVSGSQTRTRTVTASPAGCTGTPPGSKPTEAEGQTCTTPPPTGALFTGGPYTVTSSTFNVPVNVPGVTRVKLTGLKATSLSWGRILGTGGTSGGLMISDAGEWWWAGAKIAGAPKVVVNVSANYDLTIPSATITCLFQTSAGQGGAQKCTLTKLELF